MYFNSTFVRYKLCDGAKDKISQICKCQVCHLISRGFTVSSLLTYHIVLSVKMWKLVIFSHLEDQYKQISPF